MDMGIMNAALTDPEGGFRRFAIELKPTDAYLKAVHSALYHACCGHMNPPLI